MLTHGNVLAYVRWHVQYYRLSEEDRVPYMAGISFDASLADRATFERYANALGDRLPMASNDLKPPFPPPFESCSPSRGALAHPLRGRLRANLPSRRRAPRFLRALPLVRL